MPRDLSLTARQALAAAESSEVWLCLVEIEHESLTAPIRLVANTQDVVHGGDTYTAYPFRLALPEERDDQLTQVRFEIDNINRLLMVAVRSITTPAAFRLKVVLASDPEVVEAGPFEFTLRDVQYDAFVISGVLMYEDVMNEPWPADTFTPASFPAIF